MVEKGVSVARSMGEGGGEEILGGLFRASIGGGVIGQDLPCSTLFGMSVHALDPSGFSRVETSGGSVSPGLVCCSGVLVVGRSVGLITWHSEVVG